MYRNFIKRLLDVVLSGLALIILCIPMGIIALMVKEKLGSPVIFSQERPGKNEKVFRMYKFRSMTDAVDKDGNPLPDEARLTPFGQKLRAASLDELPEIWNIFKGDMSIIGPRPLLVKYLPRYNEEQHHRHDVRPGLTGLAQINGRNAISWTEKFKYDIEYVNNLSFALDVRIFFKTIEKVLKHEGISSDNSATMEEFTGNN